MLKSVCFWSFYENICVTFWSLILVITIARKLDDIKPRELNPFIYSDLRNVKENWIVSQGMVCLFYQLLLLFSGTEWMNGYNSFVFISSSFFATKTTLRCVRQYTEKKADEDYEREDRVVPVVWKRSWRSVLLSIWTWKNFKTFNFWNKDLQSGQSILNLQYRWVLNNEYW